MDTQISFRNTVEAILSRYSQTPLTSRWKEATLSDPDPKPLAFWIRESDDLVNIIWLTRHHIKDITWFPMEQDSTFSLVHRSAIVGFEVHEKKDVARSFGFKVAGDYLVSVHTSAAPGALYWVASNAKEATELSYFLRQLVSILQEG